LRYRPVVPDTGVVAASTVHVGARDKLLAVADRLFYARGLRAVGVKEIVDEAEVAKTSLYLHFASKDDLVLAYLESRAEEYMTGWRRLLAETADLRAPERLDAVFRTLREYAATAEFRGCPFLNAAAELFDPEHAGHGPITRYRAFVRRELFGEIVRAAGVVDHDQVAAQLQVLYDGALAGATVEGSTEPVERAGAVARAVLATAIRDGGGAG
jgi:AcrR family transcriptional regulator